MPGGGGGGGAGSLPPPLWNEALSLFMSFRSSKSPPDSLKPRNAPANDDEAGDRRQDHADAATDADTGVLECVRAVERVEDADG